MNLIPDQAARQILEDATQNVFDTFKRPFQLYIQAQKAFLSTAPSYSRFSEIDQNTFNPPVTPQVFTVSGTLLYANQQPWEYISPENRNNYQQDKLRNSAGILRLKVDQSGYALMQGCKLISVDGFEFKLVSNARPHGVFSPARYTYMLMKVD